MAKKQNKILIPVLSVVLGFIVGAVIILLSGRNPLTAYAWLFRGAFQGIFSGDFKRFGDTLLQMTPLILSGLSVAFAFKTGLFNIGVSGQMLFGGFLAVYVGVTVDLPRLILLPFAILIAILGGALWALVPGLLKSKFRIHEVVVSIMMNYTALWVVQALSKALIPGNYNTESAPIKESASLRADWMDNLFNGSSLNLGIFLAFAAVFIVWLILDKTTFGYELKAVGFNPEASKYAGMKVDLNIILSMAISGALAGLAGASYYIGYTNHIPLGRLPQYGFDGIAVSLLGLNSPIGVIFSSLLFGIMTVGKGLMKINAGVQEELVQIIIGIIIYFSAASLLIKTLIERMKNRRKVKVNDDV